MMTFRPANLGDACFLLQLRNDPSAYKNFLKSRAVEPKNHLNWLKKNINDKKSHLFIILKDQKQIGQIRFDQENTKDAEISITIGKEFRGMGYGKIAIASGSKFFLKNHKIFERIIARVKNQNQVSIKAFVSAGYSEYKKDEKFVYLEYKIELKSTEAFRQE